MKKFVLPATILILIFLSFITLNPETSIAKGIGSSSQCVNCHTNVSKLIRLSWEIEKIKPKPGKSAETSGEG
ncbi:MAG: hypothetical protein ISS67_00095 [Desulfobacterales bacterium]|uniref:Uncharacterized protein n=1 Tax=Candidatus Desulfaltia bathyphila TaxID=2841697 RepID=A0A8J6T827_9BACT|nr:hypothetical protein [Candidatus Desulfaltia bathyphila]MBL7194889.1 hypothetical protein [Desulfobacterales bacterium]MBL7206913.1 hypothetical protein [Desulfobacterales bacterium]